MKASSKRSHVAKVHPRCNFVVVAQWLWELKGGTKIPGLMASDDKWSQRWVPWVAHNNSVYFHLGFFFFSQVSWIRKQDVVVLTHGHSVFTTDNRVTVSQICSLQFHIPHICAFFDLLILKCGFKHSALHICSLNKIEALKAPHGHYLCPVFFTDQHSLGTLGYFLSMVGRSWRR